MEKCGGKRREETSEREANFSSISPSLLEIRILQSYFSNSINHTSPINGRFSSPSSSLSTHSLTHSLTPLLPPLPPGYSDLHDSGLCSFFLDTACHSLASDLPLQDTCQSLPENIHAFFGLNTPQPDPALEHYKAVLKCLLLLRDCPSVRPHHHELPHYGLR